MKKQVIMSLFNQACTSAFQFALSLYMIKFWPTEMFGIFAIIFAVGLILVGVQNAMINTPYSILRPVHQKTGKWLKIESSLAVFNLVLVVATVITSLVFVYCFTNFEYFLVILVGVYFSSLLIKEFYKNIAIVKGMMQLVAIVELCGIAGVLLCTFVYFYTIHDAFLSLGDVLLIIAVSNLLVALVIKLKVQLNVSYSAIYRSIDTYSAFIWRDSRWSFFGMITTELQNRGYIFIVSVLLGTAEVGLIQAGRVFFGPLNLLTGAWGRIARPKLAALYQVNETREMQKIVWFSLLGFVAFNLFFGLLLWLMWPYLHDKMFGQDYGDIGYVVALWAVATLILHVRSTFSIAAQAMFEFKSLAFSTLIGAFAALTITFILALQGLENSIVLAIVIGELLTTIYIVKYTLKYSKQGSAVHESPS